MRDPNHTTRSVTGQNRDKKGNDRKLFNTLAVMVVVLGTGPGSATADVCPPEKQGNDNFTGILLTRASTAWHPVRLPHRGDLDMALASLDYAGELPQAHGVDLDGDGVDELFLDSPNGRLCGNAGCPYVLLEAVSMRRLGEFFGLVALLEDRSNGYRIIQTYASDKRDGGHLTTHIFSHGRYQSSARQQLDTCEALQWVHGLRAHP